MSRSNTTRRILVTDGEQRASLAVARSLGAAGHTVFVSAANARSLAGASRFVISELLVTDPLAAPNRFVDDIYAITIENNIDTIIPISEPALLAILPQRERFAGVCIPFTNANTFAAICDKQRVLDAAGKVGIAIPHQAIIANTADAAAIDMSSIQFPLVVKPARSVSIGDGSRLKLSAQYAQSPAELRQIVTEMDPRAYPLLLQQRIIGTGVGIFVLLWDDALLAQFAHRRLREKPPSGGVSVYRESWPVDAELLQRSLALLGEFDWRGVAMIEYKIDTKTGTPYLMEINGRFWGSLQLAVDSGVDFPRLLLDASTNCVPSPVCDFRKDVRSRWFWGDVDHLLIRFRRSAEELSLVKGAPSRWDTLREFFTHHPNDKWEIQRRGDFMPFVRESVQWFQQLIIK